MVVGSGFGGAVAALRLAEKGYSVSVLEAGASFSAQDFPRSTWDLKRFLWAPRLGLYGIQRVSFLRSLMVLTGAGVGGGSLVYANVLLEPGDAFYNAPANARIDPPMRRALAPHFLTAKRMLGVAAAPREFAADSALRDCATEMGRAQTFSPAPVGVYFGDQDRETPDPYFAGQGPPRSGCRFCGGCMVGCRYNAKNTLDKNYLHLAAGRGAKVYSLSCVARLEPAGTGYSLSVRKPGWSWGGKRIKARRLVLSAGVLGTVRLLLESRASLKNLSPRLGRDVRTNSEVLTGAVARGEGKDYSQGTAIGAGFWPDPETHVQAVRYPAGSDFMALSMARSPLSALWPFGWARRSAIFLTMQTSDSRVRLSLREGLFPRLEAEAEQGSPPLPLRLAAEKRVQEIFCRRQNAVPQESLAGRFGLSTTAHILGGAGMGKSPEEGVVDGYGKAHGCPNLWVADGSLIAANLGVNPSLTITALAEHVLSAIPAKS